MSDRTTVTIPADAATTQWKDGDRKLCYICPDGTSRSSRRLTMADKFRLGAVDVHQSCLQAYRHEEERRQHRKKTKLKATPTTGAPLERSHSAGRKSSSHEHHARPAAAEKSSSHSHHSPSKPSSHSTRRESSPAASSAAAAAAGHPRHPPAQKSLTPDDATVKTIGALKPGHDGLKILGVDVVHQAPSQAHEPARLLLAMTARAKKTDENLGYAWICDGFTDVDVELWKSDPTLTGQHSPLGPHWDAKAKQLIVSRCGSFSEYQTTDFLHTKEKPAHHRQYGAKAHGTGKPVLPYSRLNTRGWGYISSIVDGKGGKQSFIAVNEPFPFEQNVSEVCWINGSVSGNPEVITLLREEAKRGAEAFTVLSGNRLIVQLGPNGERWTTQGILDFGPLLAKGSSVTWSDVDAAKRCMIPVEFDSDGRGSNSQFLLELPDGTLVLAEKERLCFATLKMKHGRARVSVYATLGDRASETGKVINGPSAICQFHNITHLCWISQGALLVVDDGCFVRLVYDRTYALLKKAESLKKASSLAQFQCTANLKYGIEKDRQSAKKRQEASLAAQAKAAREHGGAAAAASNGAAAMEDVAPAAAAAAAPSGASNLRRASSARTSTEIAPDVMKAFEVLDAALGRDKLTHILAPPQLECNCRISQSCIRNGCNCASTLQQCCSTKCRCKGQCDNSGPVMEEVHRLIRLEKLVLERDYMQDTLEDTSKAQRRAYKRHRVEAAASSSASTAPPQNASSISPEAAQFLNLAPSTPPAVTAAPQSSQRKGPGRPSARSIRLSQKARAAAAAAESEADGGEADVEMEIEGAAARQPEAEEPNLHQQVKPPRKKQRTTTAPASTPAASSSQTQDAMEVDQPQAAATSRDGPSTVFHSLVPSSPVPSGAASRSPTVPPVLPPMLHQTPIASSLLSPQGAAASSSSTTSAGGLEPTTAEQLLRAERRKNLRLEMQLALTANDLQRERENQLRRDAIQHAFMKRLLDLDA